MNRHLGPYLREVYGNFNQCVKNAVGLIKQHSLKFDTIVFTGVSGALIAPIVAQKLRKEIIVVRKQDNRHSDCTIEGFLFPKNYIIIDDFVVSGATIKRVYQSMLKGPMVMDEGNRLVKYTEDNTISTANLVAVVCYHPNSYNRLLTLSEDKFIQVFGMCW